MPNSAFENTLPGQGGNSTTDLLSSDLLAQRRLLEQKLLDYQPKMAELEKQLQDPTLSSDNNKYREVSINYSEAAAVVQLIQKQMLLLEKLNDNAQLQQTETDPELLEMSRAEKAELAKEFQAAFTEYQELLLPKDPAEAGNAIIEIRAGTGGDEASLFAQEIFRSYGRFAEKMGFQVEIANISYSTSDGFKEVIFFVSGKDVYKYFRFESGVHRVQRVPVTENAGRIHTSTISVVVLPEISDVEVDIKAEDLRIDVYRSGGPGGQGVNTTDSAVRIVHLPTGITVTCQDERSQLKNKAKAMKILTAKLYDKAKQEAETKSGNIRQTAIKSGDRSDKIRTYNFPQSRITDHRVKISWHNLAEVMEGNWQQLFADLRQAMLEPLSSETSEA